MTDNGDKLSLIIIIGIDTRKEKKVHRYLVLPFLYPYVIKEQPLIFSHSFRMPVGKQSSTAIEQPKTTVSEKLLPI